MPPAPTADSNIQDRPYLRKAGAEPLPGYVLIEPLGRGGFGEVWKCEAPGGLHKAVKFVAGNPDAANGGDQLRQEFDAFQQIKAIRHPFLLTLERVELVKGTLLMVMELADRQLADRFRECRRVGLPGIPRGELLGYLGEAAEALDVIGTQYGLQHLDVKPANLFLVANHVKVGDYGLVSRQAAADDGNASRGLTPRYVAPEVLRGEVDTRSDQYSLALVYQELLTGCFAYQGKTAPQLMMQHMMAPPDLAPLPEADREVVAVALAKQPDGRFPSCVEFVRALMAGPDPGGLPNPGLDMRRARLDRAAGEQTGRHSPPDAYAPEDTAARTDRHGLPAGAVTQNATLPGGHRRTTPGGVRPLPPLVTATRPPQTPPPRTPPPARPALSFAELDLPAGEPEGPPRPRLDPIRSVVTVAQLRGESVGDARLAATHFAAAVVEAAGAGGHVPQMAGDIGRRPDGTWVCRFPTTIPAAVAPLKLAVVKDAWPVWMEQPDPLRLVFKRAVAASLWGALSGKKSGLEVTVRMPEPGRSVGEVTVTAGLFGTPDKAFAQAAHNSMPQLIADIRRELQNVDDRRKHPRIAADFGVRLYPIHSDGGIDDTIPGRCVDVSAGGLAVVVSGRLPTKYSYVAFDGIAATSGAAILMKMVRHQPQGRDLLIGGQYRTDL